ncbi:hypothetical protein [Christensenella timonensis]|uniref:hypothetical protein n=1 Tax=Christensenella timonensis TaxID=1816678 RepID=UPI000832B52C|nr:hypothetical protein [Christensenella timonensis]
MNWFRKFMMGRYGGDQLGMFLIILSIVLSIVLMFVPVAFIGWLSWIPLVFAVYRMFSKNITRRQQENFAYLRKWGAIKTWFWKLKSGTLVDKTHKTFKCPKCGQKLRVPRGKGKISITCSKCGNKFVKKT